MLVELTGAKRAKETERQPGATQRNKRCTHGAEKKARERQIRARVPGQCVLF